MDVFWHGHKGCKYFVIPKTRTKWWKEKIERNIERDQITEKELKSEGWKVIVIWECELKPGKRERTLASMVKSICQE
jgi:DNA mismatch endonuclease (patch repair protein)